MCELTLQEARIGPGQTVADADRRRIEELRELVWHDALDLGCSSGQAAAAINAAENALMRDPGSAHRAREEGRRIAEKLRENRA